MSAYPARERRQSVKIGARLKSGRGWSNVVLRNVSPHGVMGLCDPPPTRGDYVEVRCGAYVIVARVAWARDDCFGARAQDVIVLPELIACSQGRTRPAPDRRREARPRVAPPPPSLVTRAAASARLGRALDFAGIALAGATLASLAAGFAHGAIAKPAGEISRALAQGEIR
jgi:hypothetical protein